MEKEIGLSEFRSSYGNTYEEEEVSDDEEWQTTCLSTSNYSRQSAMFPPAKKRRIDSSFSNPKLQSIILAKKPSMQPDSCLGHSRTIIHVDIDCFYAQVEMIRNPELRSLPLGIQQKHIVVTCNYVARKRGIKKLSYISDAKKKCPDLVLVNGEDLTTYREFSGKVHSLLSRDFTPLVEKLGMDENFLDVTELVTSRLETIPLESTNFSGAVYSRSSDSNEMKAVSSCRCGCHERLKIGSLIAAEVRRAILEETGLTCCAGISHNKLLAKLVGGWKKPNMQTTLLPEDAESLLSGLQARDIPGIGHSMAKKLRTINVLSVTDLLSCPSQVVEKECGNLQATLMTKLCQGIDDSTVTPSGEFKTITDEDSFKKCSTLDNARKRLVNLIEGLLSRISSDIGIPQTVRVTVRRQTENSYKRESRQCRLQHIISYDDKDKARVTLLTTCLQLFNKLVDVKKPFHLTLLGVSLSNFHKSPTTQSKDISNFFQKSFPKHKDPASFANSLLKNSNGGKVELCGSLVNTNEALSLCGGQEPQESSELNTQDTREKEPQGQSKLNTQDTQEKEPLGQSELNTQDTQESETSTMTLEKPVVCPKGVDPVVFAELPPDMQRELETQWQQDTRMPMKNTVKTDKVMQKPKRNSGIQRYFAKEQAKQSGFSKFT